MARLKLYRNPDDAIGSRRIWQTSLKRLFLATTIMAIACAGFARLGFRGAVGILFSCWLLLLGLFCVSWWIRQRKQGRVVGVLFGILFSSLGLMGLGIVTTAERNWEFVPWTVSIDFADAIAFGIVIFLGWWAMRPKWPMMVKLRSNGTVDVKGFPKSIAGDVREFFESAEHVRGAIYLRRQADGRMEIRFRRISDVALRQRIRNFLLSVL